MSPDHNHLDFGYLGVQELSSYQSPHRSLLRPQHSHTHDVATAGDFNPSAPTFGFYSNLIVCGVAIATAGDVKLCVWASTTVGLPAQQGLGFPLSLYM
jgi:hypothetical protein